MTSRAPGTIVLAHSLTRGVFNLKRGPVKGQVALTRQLFSSPSAAPQAKNAVCAVRTVVRSVPLGADLDFLRGVSVLVLGSDRKLVRFSKQSDVANKLAFTLLHPNGASTRLRTDFHTVSLGRAVFGRGGAMSTSGFKGLFQRGSITPCFTKVAFVINLLVLLANLLGFFRFLAKDCLGHSRRFNVHGIGKDGNGGLF